jgi:hypothetical protein
MYNSICASCRRMSQFLYPFYPVTNGSIAYLEVNDMGELEQAGMKYLCPDCHKKASNKDV